MGNWGVAAILVQTCLKTPFQDSCESRLWCLHGVNHKAPDLTILKLIRPSIVWCWASAWLPSHCFCWFTLHVQASSTETVLDGTKTAHMCLQILHSCTANDSLPQCNVQLQKHKQWCQTLRLWSLVVAIRNGFVSSGQTLKNFIHKMIYLLGSLMKNAP